jgi:ribosomal protein L15E
MGAAQPKSKSNVAVLRALVERLRSDGIDPAKYRPTSPERPSINRANSNRGRRIAR